MVLAAFKKMLRAGTEAEILGALADAAVLALAAGGAAVVQVQATGEARVVEARNLPEDVAAFADEVDAIDVEVGDRLLALCGGRFERARTIPVMSGGDLFGALVLFFAPGTPARPDDASNTDALCDLAGITLGKARQFEDLRRSYAEVRASREVLQRTEKLRALGVMAAGISHDLRNILNPLSLHLQLLRRILSRASLDPETGGGAGEAIDEMDAVLRRGVETLERLRDFSRQAPEARRETVDLNALAHEALEIARPRIAALRRPRGIRVVEAFGAPPPILARSAELVSALVNLAVNAIDAMTEGGTLTVTTGADDRVAWVRVEDDGPGIPDELHDRIFEPFFTTKGNDGTGLGLAMVYAAVQRQGGTITLESSPGRGASFTLRLPAISS